MIKYIYIERERETYKYITPYIFIRYAMFINLNLFYVFIFNILRTIRIAHDSVAHNKDCAQPIKGAAPPLRHAPRSCRAAQHASKKELFWSIGIWIPVSGIRNLVSGIWNLRHSSYLYLYINMYI